MLKYLVILLAITFGVNATAQHLSGIDNAARPSAARTDGPVSVTPVEGGSIVRPSVTIGSSPVEGQMGQAPVMVQTGTLASEVLQWVVAAFLSTMGTIGSALLYRWLQHMGIQLSDAQRSRLQDIIQNGLSLAANEAEQRLQGRGQIAIKNEAVARTVQYVQNHAKDTIKSLGLDPTDGKTVEAIKARIESSLLDPKVPTPVSITPPQGKGPQQNGAVHDPVSGQDPRTA